MALAGRGAYYTFSRHVTEELMHLVLCPGQGWLARLSERLHLLSPLRVHQHRVAVPRWPAGAPPLRIAFGSDFHAGPTTTVKQLETACAALAAARPDVLLLGGDFVYLHAENIDVLAPLLGRVPVTLAPGRFAVLGNHDLWANDAYITRRLEQAGVRVLVNEAVRLPPPFAHVSICGLDEPWFGSPDAAAAVRGADGVRVVLMHAPSGLLRLGERRFDLALCGHTHGGHIALPGGIPVIVPGQLSRRYPHGRFDLLPQGGTLIVSRGVGGAEVPVRLFADPDVVVCELGQV